MNENDQQTEFFSIAMNFLSMHRDHQMIILVDNGQGGVESLHSNTSFVWAFGMLSMSEKSLTSQMEENRNREVEDEMHRQRENEINPRIRGDKGKAN